MVFQKNGLPEEGDIVICTVKKILFHSVFVSLDEYHNKEGMIHISEVAPGRIRNIRDYVKEEKKVICKALRVDLEKGHVDLSLRRVNNSERINKNNEYKQEQKAERILESLAKENKKNLEEMYKEVGIKIIDTYGSLREGFQSISFDNELIKNLNLNKKIEDSLLKIINEKIRPPEVMIQGTLTMQSNASDGIDIIKKILSNFKDKNLKISYISAPKYRVVLKGPDYKSVELRLKELRENFITLGKENNCLVDFTRSDDK
jgi:translation initiation factor 2 subunit 1